MLAGTYNMGVLDLDKFEILEAPDGYDLGTVTVDDGGGASHTEQVLSVVLDRKALPVGIRTWVMRAFDVPNTLWINNWLSIEGVIGMNGFMTGVVFTGDFGDFDDGGDSPEPEQRVIMLHAFSVSDGKHDISVNGVALSDGTKIGPDGVPSYAISVPVSVGDVITRTYDTHGANAGIYVIDDDGVRSEKYTEYTVVGTEAAIISSGTEG